MLILIHVINLFQDDSSSEVIASEFLPGRKFNINNTSEGTSSSNNLLSHEQDDKSREAGTDDNEDEQIIEMTEVDSVVDGAEIMDRYPDKFDTHITPDNTSSDYTEVKMDETPPLVLIAFEKIRD